MGTIQNRVKAGFSGEAGSVATSARRNIHYIKGISVVGDQVSYNAKTPQNLI